MTQLKKSDRDAVSLCLGAAVAPPSHHAPDPMGASCSCSAADDVTNHSQAPVRPAEISVDDAPSAAMPATPAAMPSPALRSLLDGLTAGELHAECCVCFDDLCDAQPLACFTHNGARTCAHFFHDICARDILQSPRSAACPLCRRDVDAKVLVPSVTDDPDGWFACVDVAGDGELSRHEVVSVLVSQFPVDASKLEQALPSLWGRWDVDGTGRVSQADFLDASNGLLAFVRRELLHETPTPAARPAAAQPSPTASDHVGVESSERSVLPEVSGSTAASAVPPFVHHQPTPEERQWADDPRVWFDVYDENRSGLLSYDQLLRALVRSNRQLSLAGAREAIVTLGLAPEAEAGVGREVLTLDRFLEVHQILLATTAQQQDVALDDVMGMLEVLLGAEHSVERDRAAAVLWEENGIVARAVMRLAPDAAGQAI